MIRPVRCLITALVFAGITLAGMLCFGAPTMPTDRDRAVNLLSRCYDDPDLFNSTILRRSPYWWRQVEIGRSVVRYRDTVAYSGNAIGKDYLVGGLVPWWNLTRHDSLVIVTGPSQTLLGTVTWKEIRRALESCPWPTGARTSIGAKASPQTVSLPGVGWGALGYSTTNVERASGQHNRNLLVIVEEASGVEPDVWEALDSLNYTRLLAIGNPIRSEGKFVDLIRQADRDRSDGVEPGRAVNAIRIPSTDSPHADLEKSPYGLADRTWLEAMERRYGRDSLWWRSHVEAAIPDVSTEALIPESWLDLATSLPRIVVPPNHPLVGRKRIAVDLGEGVGRDATCILVRDDLGILEVVAGNTLGLAEAADRVASLARKWHVEHECITFDALGIGRDFPNHLYRVGIRDAKPYFGNAPAKNGKEYTNVRTWAAWQLRRRLDPDRRPDLRFPAVTQAHFAIPHGAYWPTMRDDLVALTYDLVGTQTRLIPKKALCEKLGRSPDRGDALIQSFAFA